jgi:hypothetical protein
MHTHEDRLAAGTENTPQRRRNGRRRPTEGRSRPAFAWPTHQPAKNAGGRVALAAAELRGAKTPHAVGRRTGAHPTWRRATIERREEATFARLPMSGRRKTPEGPSRMPPANSLAGKCLTPWVPAGRRAFDAPARTSRLHARRRWSPASNPGRNSFRREGRKGARDGIFRTVVTSHSSIWLRNYPASSKMASNV